MSAQPLRLAVAGLGTVGIGVLEGLAKHQAVLSQRAARPLKVVAVSARDRHRDRGVDLAAYDWVDNPVELAGRDDVDVVVELIGGADGPALALAKEALGRGKSFVTANKALIAHHGGELADLAETNDAALKFEAGVAGGIPVLKALREGMSANDLDSLHGILNGTCNYILTVMEREGTGFAEVLEAAQKAGYAEADPSFDVDGIDAAHKTAILAALAFGMRPDFDALSIKGIRQIAPIDIAHAADLGYRIKLLGLARRRNGAVEQRVHPCMVSKDTALAHVGGVTNAVVATGDLVGQTVYEGAGAGAGPTASAVIADVVDIAHGCRRPAFSVPADDLKALPTLDPMELDGNFYLRLRVVDRPGVIAEISSVLAGEDVSLASLIQRDTAETDGVYVVLTTHRTNEGGMTRASRKIGELDSVLEEPVMLRIERFDQ